jgi:glucose/arabinose dehydrogenase
MTIHRSRATARLAPASLAIAMLVTACGTPGGSGTGSAIAGASYAGHPRSGAPNPSEPGSTIPPLDTGPDALALEAFASGLAAPTGLATADDGSGTLYVTEKTGRVRVVGASGEVRDTPLLDISDLVDGSASERGLLGLAFHPDYAANGRLYVDYTDRNGDIRVVEYTAHGGVADRSTARGLLDVPHPASNHNGGQLAFGPDGYLYIGMGDGGGGDPQGNSRNPHALLAKILRLDVDAPPPDGQRYAIPATNPFAPGAARAGQAAPEVWALGLRNPWRFSFDATWGDLYIADVGAGTWEEIDRQPADSSGGEDYGWNIMEGRSCLSDPNCDQRPFVKPIAQYGHDQGCAEVGGYVYRGTAQPELDGVYVFADYCSGRVFTLQVDEGTTTPKPVLDSGLAISSFGQAENGELYLTDLAGGTIQHVVVGG